MALQPSIILAGTQPDILGAMSRGNELAAQTNTLRDQNALRDVYRTQGANLLQGDQRAINALAMIDPMTAANIRNTNLEGTYTAERTRILGAEEQRKIAEAARLMDEQQKAAALEATKREVFRFLAAPDAATFDQMVTQAGKPELVGQFDRRQILAADYVSSVEEALKLGAGPEQPAWRAATSEEASARGASAGQINTKTGEFKAINPPSRMAMRTNPDGTTEIIQGPNASFTEGQSKDNVYATRAEGALLKLEPVANELTSRAGRVGETLGGITLGVSRELLQSDDFQVAKNAGDEFLQAILRKDTGAAITTDEQDLYGVTYLPQPGDRDAVLQAKAEARVRAIEAIRAGMNVDQLEAVARAERAAIERLAAEGGGATAATPAAPATSIPPGAIELLRQNNTPDYRRSFDEIFGPGSAARVLGGN